MKFGEKIKLEGATMVACKDCSSLGTKMGQVRDKPKPKQVLRKVQNKPEKDVVIDFATKIKDCRERRNWTQRDLAKEINEKESVINRIEANRMVPSIELAQKFEKLFNITLIEEVSFGAANLEKTKSAGLTIGDVVKIKRRA